METLFSPNSLLVSPSDWADPTRRDVFLNHVWGYLDVVEVLGSSSLLWSTELTAALFTNPRPPWIADSSWRNQLVQAIYPTIEKHLTLVPSTSSGCSCSANPAGSCTSCSPSVDLAFLKLIHGLRLGSKTLLLLGSPNDMHGTQNALQFDCVRHAVSVAAHLCRNRSEYAKSLRLSSLCWPTRPDNRNYERLTMGVQLTAETELTWPAGKRLVAFQCSRRFLDDLGRQTAYRSKILKALALRLMVGQATATMLPTLLDEDPRYTDRGRKGERRFRATQESRFHYLPLGGDSIRLVRFFGPGEHDDGLR
jgi:hypothetical protein